ncbi:hypothetical protein [Roseobacter weihaiensis]|uniref:hypothetical protein n=1 Tax=Roseobacter weihaiensis TaxID=2763262 RepID=UPI001D0A3D17|nr:hypothetical protein [Roseobacter sp. H9]
MAHWYTADTHFGHENIITFCNRPFANTDDMDATMLKNLADRVGPDDDLWIIGDFAFGRKAKDVPFLNEVFNQLPGARKHLITGNHDFQPTLELGWDTVSPFIELRDGPQKQLNTLCHYLPVVREHYDIRELAETALWQATRYAVDALQPLRVASSANCTASRLSQHKIATSRRMPIAALYRVTS